MAVAGGASALVAAPNKIEHHRSTLAPTAKPGASALRDFRCRGQLASRVARGRPGGFGVDTEPQFGNMRLHGIGQALATHAV